MREDISPRTATTAGFGAILLWGTLASLTALKSAAIPPFQTTAIAFAVGGAADFPDSSQGFVLAFFSAVVWASYSVASRPVVAAFIAAPTKPSEPRRE